MFLRGPGVQRAISPADMRMADHRNGNARWPWIWLRMFAMHGGRMPIGPSSSQKQKQFVSESLRHITGIAEDPIDNAGGCYVAKLTLTAHSLTQGRAEQRERNFLDDD